MMTYKLEFATTRDLRMPLYEDDEQLISVPPKPDGRGEWHIYDDSSDKKTKWVRRVTIEGAP